MIPTALKLALQVVSSVRNMIGGELHHLNAQSVVIAGKT